MRTCLMSVMVSDTMSKSCAGVVTGTVMSLCRFSPNLPQKEFSMRLAVVFLPGFFLIMAGSKSISSRAL